MSNDDRPDPLIPSDDESPSVGEPSQTAGGVPAVTSTLEHASRKMGVFGGMKTLLQMNQEEGFDCPGCAWPDPGDRSMVEFCENGAKAVADEADVRRVTPDFFADYSVPELLEKSGRWLNDQGRLTHPVVRREGSDHYEAISWDDAFELIGQELRALDSPDEAIFYTSGRTSNEAAFLYQLFVREYGTNNLPDCSNMCHESSGVGLGEVIGVGKGTVLLEDFDEADAIFVIGQNPGTNHPRMLTALQSAARGGTQIVSVNPLRETGLVRFKHPQEVRGWIGRGTPLADLFIQVRINGDVALLKGIMKYMLIREERRPGTVLDQDFIDEHCEGYEAFAEDLRQTSWEHIIEASGVEREIIERAAEIAIESERTICCWAMGLTQHKNGVANIQEVVNFLLMRGQIGKPGAGACPVRGHSNVQGDRTMGIWDRPTEDFLDRLDAQFGIEAPREHGYDTVHAIKAMHAGDAGVFVGMGGNFLSATPDTNLTADALENCSLTVQISTKLNRAHLVTGERALILPCLGRTEMDMQAAGEQFVSVENSMGVVHSSEGSRTPASEHLLSEPAIVAGMANATLGEDSKVPWTDMVADYDRIREAIEGVVDGFEDYNERVRQSGGFVLPNAARERRFETDSGRAKFTVHPIPEHDLDDGEFLMMTIRSHDQFNTTVYSNDDRYRGIKGGRRVVMLNERDIEEQGLEQGARVDLVSEYDGVERVAPGFRVVPYDLPRRSAGTYFPEANVLVAVDDYADRSHTPASKSVVIRLRPADSPDA
jgi:molybdopterin-dependent oxidoreductase alpha subunit